MRIDFMQQMKTINGVPIVEKVGDETNEDGSQKVEPVTLKTIVLNALLAEFPDEKQLSGEEKVSRWALAQKIYGGNNEVPSEDIARIKKLVAKAFATTIVGPAFAMLEGE